MLPNEKAMQTALRCRYGAALQEKFSSATVAICGLGGLGSAIAVALARSGIGTLILIDHDRVDVANLHRQQYKAAQVGRYKTDALRENLREIAPYVTLRTHTTVLTARNAPALLRDAHIVCEAFDDAAAKAMLADTVLTAMDDTFLVAASGMAGFGSPNTIRTRRITARFFLCGDGVDRDESLTAPRVMLCAAHQAQTVLRILGGFEETNPNEQERNL